MVDPETLTHIVRLSETITFTLILLTIVQFFK